MRNLLRSTLILAVMACAALSAAAESTSKVYIPDFAIQKGEVKYVYLYVDNPDYTFSAMQFDLYFTGGLKLFVDEDGEWIYPLDNNVRIPGVSGKNVTFVHNGAWQSDGAYRFLFYNSKALPVTGTSGALLEIGMTTDETFGTTTEKPAITIANTTLSDTKDTSSGDYPLSTPTTVYESVLLTDFLATTDSKVRYIADPLKIIAKTASAVDGKYLAFATDGNENWIKFALNEADNAKFEEGSTYSPDQLGGVLADANVNPAVLVEKALGNEVSTTPVTASETKADMSTKLNLKANEVVSVTGYYFKEGEEENLRAYSGTTGNRGQSLTLNFNWVGTSFMTEAKPYTIEKGAIQLKAAWEKTNAPALVAPSDENAFQNYVIYPLSTPQVATEITDLNAGKSISNVRYVNTLGVEAATPFEGVNIVVTTYNDGTISTAKVIK